MKTLATLCVFTALFAALLLAVCARWPLDLALRATFSGLLTGWSGALLLFLTARNGPPPTSAG